MKINSTIADVQIRIEISERIKQYRISADMTQTMLAEKSGVSIKTISRFESGEEISLTNFIKILKALELDNNLELLVPDHTTRPSFYVGNRQERKRASKPKDDDSEKWKWGE